MRVFLANVALFAWGPICLLSFLGGDCEHVLGFVVVGLGAVGDVQTINLDTYGRRLGRNSV
jgi:hypothetical protein